MLRLTHFHHDGGGVQSLVALNVLAKSAFLGIQSAIHIPKIIKYARKNRVQKGALISALS